MPFLCPLCHAPLASEGRSLRCPSSHCFDRAKSGYVNLLPASGGIHGDDKRMVRARRAFLDLGCYAPLMAQIASLSASLLPENGILLDCGCGEGSYTAAAYAAICEKKGSILGVDVSKDAVDLAAKRLRSGDFAVASVYRLPVADQSVDGILNLFAPMAEEEYCRVLKKGGFVIKATPLPDHLIELKEAVYDQTYLTKPEPEQWQGFEAEAHYDLRFSFALHRNDAILSLFEMTPYCYTTSAQGRERLSQLSDLTVTAAFHTVVYRRL